MQLREWESALQQTILTGADHLDSKLRLGSIARETRIQIYTNAYRLRLAEALRTNYPATHQLLGDEDFDELANRYLEAHPSTHTSIRWFGSQLATYLAEHPPYAQLPVFAELAHFEWALRHTVDAADAKITTVSQLMATDPDSWGNLTFSWHPSVSLLKLDWNTPAVWRALLNDEDPPEPLTQAMEWLVWRAPDLSTLWRSISTQESWALQTIRQGKDFSTLCEGLAQLAQQEKELESADIPRMAATLLRGWVEEGLLV